MEGRKDWFGGDDSWPQIKEILDQTTEERRERLEKHLNRIYDQLEYRYSQFEAASDRIEQQISRASNELARMYNLPTTGGEETKSELKDRLSTLYNELDDRHRNLWRDVQRLEQEKREIINELEELEAADISDLV